MKPILFNTRMVKAIIDGDKDATRRLIKVPVGHVLAGTIHHKNGDKSCMFSKPGTYRIVGTDKKTLVFDDPDVHTIKQPYKIGDILYVRETFAKEGSDVQDGKHQFRNENYDSEFATGEDLEFWGFVYRADTNYAKYACDWPDYEEHGIGWKPSIHMPKSAARIFLQVKDVRLERLQDMSLYDCFSEGVEIDKDQLGPTDYESYMCELDDALESFGKLWDSIYPKEYSFASNPWVWAIEYKKVDRLETELNEQTKTF